MMNMPNYYYKDVNETNMLALIQYEVAPGSVTERFTA